MKKIIKLTEGQLKRMVEQTVNQEGNQFFKLIHIRRTYPESNQDWRDQSPQS